jgi:hypothetical protein
MEGIYNYVYIPEANHVSRLCSVAAVQLMDLEVAEMCRVVTCICTKKKKNTLRVNFRTACQVRWLCDL